MKLHLKAEIVCGRRLLYPECEKSVAIMKLMKRRKTIPLTALVLLTKCGFKLEIGGDPAIVKMLVY